MDKLYIDIINKYSELIDSNDWETLYANLYETYNPRWSSSGAVIGRFTNLMLTAGLNPLAALTYIPAYFAYEIKLDKVDIPKHVFSIDDYAFAYTEGYTELYIPGNIDCISLSAFQGCSAYRVEIEDGCQIIWERAFAYCDNLKEVIIPRSVYQMGDNIFQNSEDVVIKCYKDSYAATYADDYDIEVEYLDYE